MLEQKFFRIRWILTLITCVVLQRSCDALLIKYPMTIYDAPYMALVGDCDAVILSRQHLFTSAHCICRGDRPTDVLVGTGWNNRYRYPRNVRRISNITFEHNHTYCSQSLRSDFVLISIPDPLIYSPSVQPIHLHCSNTLPEQLVATGYHLPGRNYNFISEAVVNVKRGEYRYIMTLNKDIPPDSFGPLISNTESAPYLFGMYSHRYGKVTYFKSLDRPSCNWIYENL